MRLRHEEKCPEGARRIYNEGVEGRADEWQGSECTSNGVAGEARLTVLRVRGRAARHIAVALGPSGTETYTEIVE